MTFNERDIWLLKNGTIALIINDKSGKIKLRCVRPCSGSRSAKGTRIGLPYTYQQWTSEDDLSKRVLRKIGDKELLNALFIYIKQRERKIFICPGCGEKFTEYDDYWNHQTWSCKKSDGGKTK